MPLIIDGNRIPTAWAGKKPSRSAAPAENRDSDGGQIELAFINNMPDSALEDTELQFFDLLDSVAGNLPVRISLFSLPNVPRGERGIEHLKKFYSGVEDLLNSHFDGMIMTGTEPKQANLRDEPYWTALAEVLNWAEENTSSTVLSCLAAHAGVLHSDGITRSPLRDKQFGVFEFTKSPSHLLTADRSTTVRFPHSRWNEVREDALISCGYSVLTRSPHAGVDLFVKQKKESLFVHFQGHPEYGAHTLLKEYRRDIKRFLRRERETYPTVPQGYFDSAASEVLAVFQSKAMATRSEEVMASFPEADISRNLNHVWQPSAKSVYRNWLQYLSSRKAEAPAFAALTSAPRVQRRSANGELA